MRSMKALPHDSSMALAAQGRNNAFRLTVAGLVSRTQQFSLQDLHFNFNERSFASGQTDRFLAEGESRPRRRLCEGGLPIDQPMGAKGGRRPSSMFTRPIRAPSRARSEPYPDPGSARGSTS